MKGGIGWEASAFSTSQEVALVLGCKILRDDVEELLEEPEKFLLMTGF